MATYRLVVYRYGRKESREYDDLFALLCSAEWQADAGTEAYHAVYNSAGDLLLNDGEIGDLLAEMFPLAPAHH